ncbi:hypothetical protein XR19_24925, partial [Salmonella enterica]|nr:hypothetical protein [Salmonella enterica]
MTTISCNGTACKSTGYTTAVSVTLSAADATGGSGLASTHYTTDGTDPTLASPTYTTALSMTSTATVKFRSWDKAGNVEATQSQLVTVDATAPVTTASCNGGACVSTGYTSAVSVTLAASDGTNGSGVASTH